MTDLIQMQLIFEFPKPLVLEPAKEKNQNVIILNGLVVIGPDRMSSGYRHNSLPISDLGVM